MGRSFFIDAAAIFAGCVLLALLVGSGAVEITLMLVISTSVLLTLSGKPLYAAELIAPAASLFLPEAVIFIPMAVYSAAARRHKIPAAFCALALLISAACGIYDGLIGAFMLSLPAAVLGLRTGELRRRIDELKKMRDADAELTMELRQKNRELLQKQDDEVNIATLRERNRIAREIHDNVGHLLSRALLQSGALLAVTDKEKLPVQYTQVSALRDTLGSAMNSIRESVHGLRDESLDLHRAINEAVGGISDKFSVKTELDFSEDMPPRVKLCFIAVIKEALSNAVKYSDGDSVRVTVREHPALYQLCVSDNGKNAVIKHNGGMGLNNMRERAEALGGIFRADASNGFRIFISIKRDGGNGL